MLIFLICANLIALGIFLIYIYNKNDNDIIGFSGTFCLVLGGIILLVSIIILPLNGSDSRKEATNLNIEYANLHYYITHLENYKERTVVENINRYNAKLKDFKEKQNSPWLNWFYPGDISECEYIIWVNENGK